MTTTWTELHDAAKRDLAEISGYNLALEVRDERDAVTKRSDAHFDIPTGVGSGFFFELWPLAANARGYYRGQMSALAAVAGCGVDATRVRRLVADAEEELRLDLAVALRATRAARLVRGLTGLAGDAWQEGYDRIKSEEASWFPDPEWSRLALYLAEEVAAWRALGGA